MSNLYNQYKEKVVNIFLLALCFLKALLCGKADKKNLNPQKILIIHAAKLGDMVCATPMFRAVKKQYPNVKLVVSGNVLNKELLEYNQDVDEYYVYHYNFFGFLKYLRQQKFDFACVVAPNFWGLALLYFSGIPSIAAPRIRNDFSPTETRTYKKLSFLVFQIDYYFGQYIPRQYLKLLRLIGVEAEDVSKHLGFSKAANQTVKRILQNHAVQEERMKIVISPGAGNKVKLWGGKKFAELADRLFEKYDCELFIIGSQGDKEDVFEMKKALSQATKIHDLSGQLSIDQLKAFISKVDLFIGVDTGPIFFAEAFSVPTIDIVGPVDEREQPPQGEWHKIVKVENRIPAVHIFNTTSIDYDKARQQVEYISLEMVNRQVDKLIDKIFKSKN